MPPRRGFAWDMALLARELARPEPAPELLRRMRACLARPSPDRMHALLLAARDAALES